MHSFGEETWIHIASFLSAGEALLVSTTTPMLSRGLDRPFLKMILREQKARRRIQLLRAMEEEARHFLEDSEEDSEEAGAKTKETTFLDAEAKRRCEFAHISGGASMGKNR